MNDEEIVSEASAKVRQHMRELDAFVGGDHKKAIAMASFMKDAMERFLDFNTLERKMLIKFLIETDEVANDALRKAGEES